MKNPTNRLIKKSQPKTRLGRTKKFAFIAVGLAVLALAITLTPKIIQQQKLISKSDGRQTANHLISAKVAITKVKAGAFDNLIALGAAAVDRTVGIASEQALSAARSGSSAALSATPTATLGFDGGSTSLTTNRSAVVDKMMAPSDFVPTYYKFIYQGEPINIAANDLPVYRRLKNNQNGSALAKALQSLNLGLIDLSSIAGPVVQNISITEDRQNGYQIYLDLVENLLSINRNYQYYQDQPVTRELTEADLPADEVIINTANQFLKRYGLDMSAYASPEVDHTEQNYWIMVSESAIAPRYISPNLQVIYPLQIEGQKVYEETGKPAGPIINVNIQANQVEGLWGLGSNDFEQSLYAVETDIKKLQNLAEQGGFRQYYGSVEEGKEIKIELGTPQQGYVKLYFYRPNKNAEELLVPCLIFPATPPKDEPFYRSSVIVPLIKEILEQESANPPQPVPLMEKATDSTVSNQ